MLVVPRTVRDALLAHARDGAPEEVCGVLGGVEDGERARVTDHRRVPNVAATPETRYELDPAEQLTAMGAIEEAGGAVVGFYHSHPRGPPRPSATDRAEATWAGARYVIVVPGEESVGCWRWTGEDFEREDVRVGASESR
ncbi:desampylase [Halomarina pelagica]|uniref:desampylase n=1 Tax=Halomarina pelagica TaxID=2961599 RepID=UPI0020C34FA7|nr:desampylase [Halomarina sp. BND7]